MKRNYFDKKALWNGVYHLLMTWGVYIIGKWNVDHKWKSSHFSYSQAFLITDLERAKIGPKESNEHIKHKMYHTYQIKDIEDVIINCIKEKAKLFKYNN